LFGSDGETTPLSIGCSSCRGACWFSARSRGRAVSGSSPGSSVGGRCRGSVVGSKTSSRMGRSVITSPPRGQSVAHRGSRLR